MGESAGKRKSRMREGRERGVVRCALLSSLCLQPSACPVSCLISKSGGSQAAAEEALPLRTVPGTLIPC